MPFQPGQVANPKGSSGRKLFVDALHSIISQEPTADLKVPPLPKKASVAHLMAQRLVEGSLRDDWKPGEALDYLREVCDRAYGKQKPVDGSGDNPPLSLTINVTQQVLSVLTLEQLEQIERDAVDSVHAV